MTDITVTVVNARSMHIAHHRRDTLNKHTLYANIWWVSRPVSTVIFQTDGWCQIFGYNKRGSGERINAFFAECHPIHSINADIPQSMNRIPFAVSA